MRLLNFGTGEIIDRLTILALKVFYGDEVGGGVAAFTRERTNLITRLSSRKEGVRAAVWFGHGALGVINAELWRSEDVLRMNRGPGVVLTEDLESVVALAFRIQALNDRRAAVIQEINDATGEAHVEKLSAPVPQEGGGGQGHSLSSADSKRVPGR